MKLEKELQIAIEAAILAGEEIMRVYDKDFSVCYKKDESPVTEADVAANHCIVTMLSEHFPEDGFLSEEVVDDQSRFKKSRYWNIDPLDGTKEFVKKNGDFSVNIALVVGKKVELGVVYLPVDRKIYYAVSGEGAFVRDLDLLQVRAIKVSTQLKPYRVLVSRSHPSKRTTHMLNNNAKDIENVTEMGSAKKGCLIAEGLFEVYYNFGLSMKWDTCAMECIVVEAGGTIMRLDDNPIDYSERNTLNHGFYIVNRLENKINILEL